MIALLRRMFGLDKPASDTPPAASPPPPKPRVSKPAPTSLHHDYREQLRIFGGITVTLPDFDLIADLVDWGYLVKTPGNSYELTKKGHAEIAASGAWSPDPDPRTDR